MSVKTQGTKVYFVDPITDPTTPALVELACPTGVSGLGGAKDQIEDTCLSETVDRSYVSGLGNPGQVSVPFNLKPGSASHQILFDLRDSGDKVSWLACLSDGTTAPSTTLGTGDVIVPPTGRTSIGWIGYIADVNIDIATNEIVRGTLTVQRSGPVTTTWKD
jgi:hypothetical protein